MIIEQAEFEGLTGVGNVQLTLDPDQRVYTFIGANGVGKTKTLEALFQVLFFSSSLVRNSSEINHPVPLQFRKFKLLSPVDISLVWDGHTHIYPKKNTIFKSLEHNFPVVFLGGQLRGIINKRDSMRTESIEKFPDRRHQYFENIVRKMNDSFGSLGMENSIEDWFVRLAQSSNPYQKDEDNRGIELETVVKLLHQIDDRVDPAFLEISGGGQVSIKIEGNKRQLSQLSSGFTSIVKLIQAIISGYGYFTNENNLQRVKGLVLIDEIESHLHLTWQVNIIPLLKRLFPNTTFYITTHSSVVLSQLCEGEAYTLFRDTDGTVRTHKISSPNSAAFADILKDVFRVDINSLKIHNSDALQQIEVKRNLLDLIAQQGEDNE